MTREKIYLAILNITSWAGQCADAEHVYGNLILSKTEKVNIDNVEEYNVKYLGENIEIRQPLTLEIAIKLDQKDSGNSHQNIFYMKNELENNEDFYNVLNTNRFETFDEVVNAGIKKYKELNLTCPFISLYEGRKYKANNYQPCSTVIIEN